MSRFSKSIVLGVSFTGALYLAVTGQVSATSVVYNPAPITSVGFNPCGSFAGAGCKTTAHFDGQSLDNQNDNFVGSLFQSAFNAWNPGGWSISNINDPNGTFNVDIAMAQQFTGVTLGGLTINILLSNLTLPTLGAGDSLVWVQGLYVNYAPGAGTIVAPYYAMDTSTLSNLTCGGTIFCPPAYPYQYNDNHFYDQPKDYYFAPGSPQAFFDANAYLAVRNYDAKTLELLDGVSYGFQNYVTPLPSTWLMLLSGFVSLGFFAYRGTKKRTAAIAA